MLAIVFVRLMFLLWILSLKWREFQHRNLLVFKEAQNGDMKKKVDEKKTYIQECPEDSIRSSIQLEFWKDKVSRYKF